MNYSWESDINKNSDNYVEFITDTDNNKEVLFGLFFGLYIGYILLL